MIKDKVIYSFYESEVEKMLENLGIENNKQTMEQGKNLLQTYLRLCNTDIENFLDFNREKFDAILMKRGVKHAEKN